MQAFPLTIVDVEILTDYVLLALSPGYEEGSQNISVFRDVLQSTIRTCKQ